MTTFNDIFRKSFVEGFNGSVPDLESIIVTMAITLAISVYIFFVYRIYTRKAFYSKGFNISLCLLAVLTSAIIISVQSSIVISLGMVGALSIVRFRTAIKDPLDLIFLFWAIGIGIICGAGLGQMAVVTSLIVTAGLFILNIIPDAKAPMLLVVNSADANNESEITAVAKKYASACKVKSRSIVSGKLDVIMEVRIKDGEELVRQVNSLDNIISVSLLSHDGEVTF